MVCICISVISVKRRFRNSCMDSGGGFFAPFFPRFELCSPFLPLFRPFLFSRRWMQRSLKEAKLQLGGPEEGRGGEQASTEMSSCDDDRSPGKRASPYFSLAKSSQSGFVLWARIGIAVSFSAEGRRRRSCVTDSPVTDSVVADSVVTDDDSVVTVSVVIVSV